jgi:hypothetical protein
MANPRELGGPQIGLEEEKKKKKKTETSQIPPIK